MFRLSVQMRWKKNVKHCKTQGERETLPEGSDQRKDTSGQHCEVLQEEVGDPGRGGGGCKNSERSGGRREAIWPAAAAAAEGVCGGQGSKPRSRRCGYGDSAVKQL